MAGDQENSEHTQFTPDDLKRISAETFVARIDYHEQIASTNDRALQLAAGTDDQFPLLVLAESQTSGRGRGSNSWWSERGSLTFSVMLATDAADLPTERWPQVSLTVGLAVCEALEELLARGVPEASLHTLPAVQLKWPNDVYTEGKKICGVLVEVPRGERHRLLLGVGINVSNSLATAPEEVREMATSLADLTGQSFALADVLVQVLKRLQHRLDPADLWSAAVREGWQKRCFLTGKTIQIDIGTRQTRGTCRGIDEDGALLLEVNGQRETHLAGVVTVL